MSTTTTDVRRLPVAIIVHGPNVRDVTPDSPGLDELAASIQSVGMVNPITVREVADEWVIVAGHRRFEAAKLAGWDSVPCIVHQPSNGLEDTAAITIAENVIRTDLTPTQEAHAYAALGASTTPERVAALVGKSITTVNARRRILDLPVEVMRLVDDGSVPLGAVDRLAEVAALNTALCRAVAAMVATRDPRVLADLRDDPTGVIRDALARDWHDPDKVSTDADNPTPGDDLYLVIPVYTLGKGRLVMPKRWSSKYGYGDPDKTNATAEFVSEIVSEWDMDKGAGILQAWTDLPDVPGSSSVREHNLLDRVDRVFNLARGAADAARAYGAGREWDRPDNTEWSQPCFFVADMEWLADQVTQQLEKEHKRGAAEQRKANRDAKTRAASPGDTPDGDTTDPVDVKAQAREEAYADRVSARRRNLDVGAAVAKMTPELDVHTARFLVTVLFDRDVLAPAVWGSRLAAEHPVKVAKGSGRETVQYPRATEDRLAAVQAARKRILSGKTADVVIGEAMRYLIANDLVDTAGLPNADTQDRYTGLHTDAANALHTISNKVAPRSVKQHRAEQAAARDAADQDDDDGE